MYFTAERRGRRLSFAEFKEMRGLADAYGNKLKDRIGRADDDARRKLREEARQLLGLCPEWGDPEFGAAYAQVPFRRAVERYQREAEGLLLKDRLKKGAELRAAVLLARALEIGQNVFVPVRSGAGSTWAQYTVEGREARLGFRLAIERILTGMWSRGGILEAEQVCRVLSLPMPGSPLTLKSPAGSSFREALDSFGQEMSPDTAAYALILPWRTQRGVFFYPDMAVEKLERSGGYERAFELASYWSQNRNKDFRGEPLVAEDRKERLFALWQDL